MISNIEALSEELQQYVLEADISNRLRLALCDVLSDFGEINIVMWAIDDFIKGLITEKDLICALNVYKSNRGKLLKESGYE